MFVTTSVIKDGNTFCLHVVDPSNDEDVVQPKNQEVTALNREASNKVPKDSVELNAEKKMRKKANS